MVTKGAVVKHLFDFQRTRATPLPQQSTGKGPPDASDNAAVYEIQ
jgi:hypothetical protein